MTLKNYQNELLYIVLFSPAEKPAAVDEREMVFLRRL